MGKAGWLAGIGRNLFARAGFVRLGSSTADGMQGITYRNTAAHQDELQPCRFAEAMNAYTNRHNNNPISSVFHFNPFIQSTLF